MARIPAQTLTPTIRVELAAFVRRVRPKGFVGLGPATPREREIADGIFRYEFLGLPPGLLIGLSGVDLGLSLFEGGSFSLRGLLGFLGGVVLFLLYRRFSPHGASPSSSFFAAALPSLKLSDADRRYAKALVAGGEGERLALLRRLTEEEIRLEALQARLGPDDAFAVAKEREEIQHRLDRTTDAEARSALVRTLALSERRLLAAQEIAPLRERIAAHRSLVDQAARTIAEGIVRCEEPLPDFERAASLSAEVSALETAVQEMRAL